MPVQLIEIRGVMRPPSGEDLRGLVLALLVGRNGDPIAAARNLVAMLMQPLVFISHDMLHESIYAPPQPMVASRDAEPSCPFGAERTCISSFENPASTRSSMASCTASGSSKRTTPGK